MTTYGTETKITSIWPFHNVQPIGVYPVSTVVPIFGEGNATFRIFPGISEDGRSFVQKRYPFYLAYDTNMVIKANDTFDIYPRTEYDTAVKFAYTEQFEFGNSFDGITVTSNQNDVLDGNRSGWWILENTTSTTTVASEFFSTPIDGRQVYLELNYKNSVPLDIYIKGNNNDLEYYVLTISTRTAWNTLYLNLTSTLTQAQATQYRILLKAAAVPAGKRESVFLDNIKVLHR